MNDARDRFAMLELDDGVPQAIAPMDDITAPTPTLATADYVAPSDGASNRHYNNRVDAKSWAEIVSTVPELNATVVKEPLYTLHGEQVPGAHATIRVFPTGVRQALGTVGDRYEVVQDRDAFSIVDALLDKGLIHSVNAGSYKARTWIYGESNLHADVVRGDQVSMRLLIGNSHDGSLKWHIGTPAIRVVCQNTALFAFNNSASKLLKLKHTGRVNEIVSTAIEAIQEHGAVFADAVDRWKYLATKQCDAEDLKEYTGYVFSKWADTDSEEVDTAGSRVYNRIVENFESGMGANYGRGTFWNAYNAVTQYLTHERGRGSEVARFSDLHFGNGANLNKRAFEGALALAG